MMAKRRSRLEAATFRLLGTWPQIVSDSPYERPDGGILCPLPGEGDHGDPVADGKLKRIDIGGGSPQPLANAISGRGEAGSPDRTTLFTPSANGPLSRIPTSGGEPAGPLVEHEISGHLFGGLQHDAEA